MDSAMYVALAGGAAWRLAANDTHAASEHMGVLGMVPGQALLLVLAALVAVAMEVIEAQNKNKNHLVAESSSASSSAQLDSMIEDTDLVSPAAHHPGQQQQQQQPAVTVTGFRGCERDGIVVGALAIPVLAAAQVAASATHTSLRNAEMVLAAALLCSHGALVFRASSASFIHPRQRSLACYLIGVLVISIGAPVLQPLLNMWSSAAVLVLFTCLLAVLELASNTFTVGEALTTACALTVVLLCAGKAAWTAEGVRDHLYAYKGELLFDPRLEFPVVVTVVAVMLLLGVVLLPLYGRHIAFWQQQQQQQRRLVHAVLFHLVFLGFVALVAVPCVSHLVGMNAWRFLASLILRRRNSIVVAYWLLVLLVSLVIVLPRLEHFPNIVVRKFYDLYEDFHIIKMPLLDSEVRGPDAIKSFSENLKNEYKPAEA